MILIVPHESGAPAAVDVERQTYQVIPDARNKFFAPPPGPGKPRTMFDFFESVEDFTHSESKAAVIAFYCLERGTKGKRYYVDLLCRSSTTRVYNVEKTPDGWIKHEMDIKGWDKQAPKVGIEICKPGNACFIYCIKDTKATNGFRVGSVKEIERAAKRSE